LQAQNSTALQSGEALRRMFSHRAKQTASVPANCAMMKAKVTKSDRAIVTARFRE
jgi:hypothetical protein